MIKKIYFFLVLVWSALSIADSPYFYYGYVLDPTLVEKHEKLPHYKDQVVIDYARVVMYRFLNDCLQSKCVNEKDLDIVKRMNSFMRENRSAGRPYYANEKGHFHPKLTQEERRVFHQIGFP